ncbi:MAG: hypothetical protein AVDCRST_MAG18-497 [uncultured Thermomicrobiales bacterium]|uniref:Uncharacterized protein n=1 Tax=uncultured Thermomicrobiales bacterium TaxID=1645740 RepID=A0A6J4UKJ7_9BACT|nr:MAG: hypothetical protein AVDCRST_MAG18-497 [uncultured Thermomicrobiales bacterium]
MMGERSAMERQPGALTRINRRWAEMPGEAREAIGDLLAEPYLRLSYPSAGAFAEAFDVVPGTAAFEAEWRRQATRCKEGLLTAYDPESRVYALCARGRDGALVALATMLTVRGTRETPLTEAIGDAASSVPTLQLLRFAFGPGLGLAAGETPERRIAEFGRICIRQPEELVALVMAGTLSLAQAAYVEERGFDEMFAQSYWRDQALPEPPLAYFGNMKSWMADGLARRGLGLRPLFLHDGAEPTERVLHSGRLSTAYFGQWRGALAPLVPPETLALGTRAAIRRLAREGFADWAALPISLPYLILNNARTTEAMANLAVACGFAAGTVEESYPEGHEYFEGHK